MRPDTFSDTTVEPGDYPSAPPSSSTPVPPVSAALLVPSAPPVDEIATLPPLPEEVNTAYPRSARTGEPCRPMVLLAAVVCSWLSVPVTVAAFARWWWQAAHIPTFTASAKLLTWTHPDPVSALAITMVVLIGLITFLMVAAAGTVAYNAWAGARWIRIGSLVCLGVTGLSYLVSWWFCAAMIPLAIGVILLWLPPVGLFFAAMADFRAPRPVPVPTSGIKYGPQPLFGVNS